MLIVVVKKDNIEKALKEYKTKVIRTRQMTILNNLKEFEKPSVRKRKDKIKSVFKYKKKGG